MNWVGTKKTYNNTITVNTWSPFSKIHPDFSKFCTIRLLKHRLYANVTSSSFPHQLVFHTHTTDISHHLLFLMHHFHNFSPFIVGWNCSLHWSHKTIQSANVATHKSCNISCSNTRTQRGSFVPLHTHTHTQKRTHKKWNTSCARSGHLSWGCWYIKKNRRFKGETYFKAGCRGTRQVQVTGAFA